MTSYEKALTCGAAVLYQLPQLCPGGGSDNKQVRCDSLQVAAVVDRPFLFPDGGGKTLLYTVSSVLGTWSIDLTVASPSVFVNVFVSNC